MVNNGTIGHGTAWDSTPEALVQADPNRFEIVQTPNFWKGTDYGLHFPSAQAPGIFFKLVRVALPFSAWARFRFRGGSAI